MKNFQFPQNAQDYFAANPRVLVIEDDRLMRHLLVDILSDVGFQVTTATNGVIGLQKLQQQPVDFVILDILLPATSGFEVYRRMQENPDTQDMPVLLVTAWTDEIHLHKAAHLGLHHLLAKPFTEDELLQEILALLVEHSRRKT